MEKEICGKREEKQGRKRQKKLGEGKIGAGWTDVREAKALKGPRGLQGVNCRKETGQRINLKSRVNSPSFLVSKIKTC